jgi:hypothetical protein
MTTGQANEGRRGRKRHRARQAERPQSDQAFGHGQDFARLMPGAADRLRRAMIATGSLGAASSPTDG